MTSPGDPPEQPVIVLRVVIRSPDLDTFIAKYSRFLKDDRIFIFTKASQPPGTRVRFTLELADGQPLLVGEGTVVRVRPDLGDAAKPPGMELQFQPLDAPSRALVARMMHARQSPQFREESTDVQTQVRGTTGHPGATLPPLEKTGAHDSVSDRLPPIPKQDDTGAVTLAQLPAQNTSQFDAPDTRPSGSFPPPPRLPSGSYPSPLPSVVPTSGEHPSGGFATPTPLPPPNPPSLEDSSPGAQLARIRLARAIPEPVGHEASAGFAGPAPPFAEAFHDSVASRMPPSPSTPGSVAGTLPANPFGNVPDNAIEYFVEWSLEHSTSPKPKLAEASFADVKMATPKAEKARPARASLLTGLALGLALGVPLGAGALYVLAPSVLSRQVIVLEPPPVARTPAAATDQGGATAAAPASEPAPAAAIVEPAKAPPKEEPKAAKGESKGETASEARPATPPAARAEPAAAAKSEARPAPASVAKSTGGVAAAPPENKPAVTASDATKVVAATPKPDGAKPANMPTDASKIATAAPKTDAVKPAHGDAAKADADGDAALELSSKPPGAQVTVDGVVRGKTPLSLNVGEGAHEVKLDKERYATVTQSVQAPAKVDVTLKRPTATLHVDSDPPGGDVTVEGKPRGKTPVDVTLDAFHHYDVQVTLLGTHPWHKRVALKPPQTDVNAKLSVVHVP